MKTDTFRTITTKEYFNGLRYCTFCKPEKVKAINTNRYASPNHSREGACLEHTHLLKQNPKPIKSISNKPAQEDTSEAMYSIEQQFGI